MRGIQKPKHFKHYELVDAETWYTFRDNLSLDLIYLLFDPNVLKAADFLRERYGPTYINTWYRPGFDCMSKEGALSLIDESSMQWRGIRFKGTPYYSPTSMHSNGCALDMHFKNYSAEEVRKDLKGASNNLIKRIEKKVNWLHIDTLDMGISKIYFFNP